MRSRAQKLSTMSKTCTRLNVTRACGESRFFGKMASLRKLVAKFDRDQQSGPAAYGLPSIESTRGSLLPTAKPRALMELVGSPLPHAHASSAFSASGGCNERGAMVLKSVERTDPRKRATIRIQDTGLGIAPNVLPTSSTCSRRPKVERKIVTAVWESACFSFAAKSKCTALALRATAKDRGVSSLCSCRLPRH